MPFQFSRSPLVMSLWDCLLLFTWAFKKEFDIQILRGSKRLLYWMVMDLLWWCYLWRWNQHFRSFSVKRFYHPSHSPLTFFGNFIRLCLFSLLTFPLFYCINFLFTFLPLVSWSFFPECLPSPGLSHCLTWFLSPSIFIWQGTLGIVLFPPLPLNSYVELTIIGEKASSFVATMLFWLDQSILNFPWQQLTCWQCSILNTLPCVSLKCAGHMHSQCA